MQGSTSIKPYENIGWFNLHRHSEFSLFDGFGKQRWGVEYAKELGQTALGITEHGSVCGLIEHSEACKKLEVKPILGCEVYFTPKWPAESQEEFDSWEPKRKQQLRNYHMCLTAISNQGYKNLMEIVTEANANCFYKKANVTLDNLRRHSEGIVCSTACIGGWTSQLIKKGEYAKAEKSLKILQSIFGERLYAEVMPYYVYDTRNEISTGSNSVEATEVQIEVQKPVNRYLIMMAERLGIKTILTADSHFVRPEHYPSFQVLWKIQSKTQDYDYSARYMPTEYEIRKRFTNMFSDYEFVPGTKMTPAQYSRYMCENTKAIADMADVSLEFEQAIPKQDYELGLTSKQLVKKLVKKGLEAHSKWDEAYQSKAIEELKVIFHLGFEDYFLMCWDIISWAKRHGIHYSHGRGSVCGSVVAYAMGISDVDPLILGTRFDRFLRLDKTSLPDIDMEFEDERRDEVLEYVARRYKGKVSQVSAFGYYKIQNLVNDLCKVFGIDESIAHQAKVRIFNRMPEVVHGLDVPVEDLLQDEVLLDLEKRYGFITHFNCLCGQVRYIGKHASALAITAGDMSDQMAVIRSAGGFQGCYSMSNLDKLHILKLDILGLNTIKVNHKIEDMVGVPYSDFMLDDPATLKVFSAANTVGVFQFDARGAKNILRTITPDNVQDVIAASALNRPAPLEMGMPKLYAQAKKAAQAHKSGTPDDKIPGYMKIARPYLPNTYGCLVFQEDILTLCRELSDVPWKDVDRMLKGIKMITEQSVLARQQSEEIRQNFVVQAIKKHPELKGKEQDLRDLVDMATGGYLFNKGHSSGYTLLSFQQAYYKAHFNLEFWAMTLAYEGKEDKVRAYESQAAKDGQVILPVSMNSSRHYSITEWGGGRCILRGLDTVKGLGPKAATAIESERAVNGPYLDRADFIARTPSRVVNKKIIEVLDKANAFETNQDQIIARAIALNSWLYRNADNEHSNEMSMGQKSRQRAQELKDASAKAWKKMQSNKQSQLLQPTT